MTKTEFLIELVRACLENDCEDADVLGCMIILHTHWLRAKSVLTLEDNGGANLLSPLTRRHASEIVAEVIKGTSKCHDPEYWHSKYDELVPFEVASDVPESWLPITRILMDKMKGSLLEDLWPD
jgi:hypothetical protein